MTRPKGYTPPAPTTDTCPSCGWVTKPDTPARVALFLRLHKCGSKSSRHDLGVSAPRRSNADTAEDVEWILTWHPWTTADILAERLGYRDPSGLQIALKRAGRGDLLEKLARNAQVAA